MEKTRLKLALFAIHLLLLSVAYCDSDEPLQVSGTKFVKDGPSLSTQFSKWEISYIAKDYLPVCGISSEKEGAIYWSNCPECEAALQSFDRTSQNVGVYDESGSQRSAADLGKGEMLSLCYSVRHTSGKYLDICLLVGQDLEVLERKSESLAGGNSAVGLQSPGINAKKLLSECADYSASATSGPLASSTGSEPSSTANTRPGGTGGIGTPIARPSNNPISNPQSSGSGDSNNGENQGTVPSESSRASMFGIEGIVVIGSTIAFLQYFVQR